jgi:hypothetical protein
VGNHNFDVNGLDRDIEVIHVSGVEGPSLYINNYRVSGPKPWGGGTTVREWKTTLRDILIAILGDPDVTDEELRRLAGGDAYGFHTELRRRQTPLLLERLATLAAEEA